MRPWLCLSLVCILPYSSSSACTVVRYSIDGHLIVARSHDWPFGEGLLVVNPRGVSKVGIFPVNPATWVSEYGSVSFVQFGREIPFAGMNERGLTIDLLQLREAKFPTAGNQRPTVNVVQWVQYQLDTAATVGEVLDSLDQVAPAPILPAQECVHYFVTDAQGGVAIVEFLEGRPVVQHGTEACQCALANSTFERCTVAREKQPANESERRYLTGIGSIADAPSSTTRMERIDFAMSTLAKVHQPGLTQWNLVYEPEERCVWFRTERATKQRYLDLDDLNFSPSVEVKVLDLDQDLKGDVLNRLKFCEPSDNERLVNNAFDRYLPEGFMRTAVKKMVLDYPKKLRVQSPELATVP